MTPPEPVAWDSRQPAANFTIFEILQDPFRPGSLFKAFWVIARCVAALGWPLALFPSYTNQKICSVFPKISVVKSRAGYSYSYKLFQISIFSLPTLFLLFTSPQITSATGSTSTIPTRLIIPGIGLDSAVIPVGQNKVEVNGQTYTQWAVDNNLIGWHNLSAPLGQIGNSVFNGHSNLYAQVFRNLGKVTIGDRIFAFAGDQVYIYVVATKFFVQEKGVTVEKRLENAKIILPTSDERLTLITCARPGATHRLIIIAYPEYSYSK